MCLCVCVCVCVCVACVFECVCVCVCVCVVCLWCVCVRACVIDPQRIRWGGRGGGREPIVCVHEHMYATRARHECLHTHVWVREDGADRGLQRHHFCFR